MAMRQPHKCIKNAQKPWGKKTIGGPFAPSVLFHIGAKRLLGHNAHTHNHSGPFARSKILNIHHTTMHLYGRRIPWPPSTINLLTKDRSLQIQLGLSFYARPLCRLDLMKHAHVMLDLIKHASYAGLIF